MLLEKQLIKKTEVYQTIINPEITLFQEYENDKLTKSYFEKDGIEYFHLVDLYDQNKFISYVNRKKHTTKKYTNLINELGEKDEDIQNIEYDHDEWDCERDFHNWQKLEQNKIIDQIKDLEEQQIEECPTTYIDYLFEKSIANIAKYNNDIQFKNCVSSDLKNLSGDVIELPMIVEKPQVIKFLKGEHIDVIVSNVCNFVYLTPDQFDVLTKKYNKMINTNAVWDRFN